LCIEDDFDNIFGVGNSPKKHPADSSETRCDTSGKSTPTFKQLIQSKKKLNDLELRVHTLELERAILNKGLRD
jgi:hypothetical protein